MIQDHTLDEAIIEIARTLKALKKLRSARKLGMLALHDSTGHYSTVAEHASAKRASLDLTRKLADLRQGR